MSAILSGISDGWVSSTWKVLWQGSLSIGIVWIICRLWKNSPPFIRSWLWRLVYLKLILIFIWTVPIRIFIPEPVKPAPRIINNSSVVAAKAIGISSGKKDYNPKPSGNTVVASDTVQENHALLRLEDILMVIWFAGVCYGIYRTTHEWLKVRNVTAEGTTINDGPVYSDLVDLCRQVGLRRIPKLMLHPNCGPMLLGMQNPVIILPEGIISEMDDLAPILAHELAHLKRLDLTWGFVTQIAEKLFFFHPLLGLLRQEFIQEQEMACDAFAINTLSVEPEYYGRLLLLGIKHSLPGHRAVTTVGMGKSYHSLKVRLTAVTKHIAISRRRKIFLILALIAITVIGLVPWVIRHKIHFTPVAKSLTTGIGDVAVDSLGNVYMADSSGSGMISKFNNDGVLVLKWGGRHKVNGQFPIWPSPTSIAAGPDGKVITAEYWEPRRLGLTPTQVKNLWRPGLQIFDPNGKFLTRFPSKSANLRDISYPVGVAVDSDGNVYVASSGKGRIAKYSRDGILITSLNASGTATQSGPSHDFRPGDMAIDRSGNLYVVDNCNIMKYNRDGRYLTQWPFTSFEHGGLYIACDRSGKVYLAVGAENCIYIYSSDGELLSKLAVDNPCGIAVDSKGNLFVSSSKMAYGPMPKISFPPGIWGLTERAVYWYHSIRSKRDPRHPLGPEERILKFSPS